MSKQSEAKKAQGYRRASERTCSNCAHYTSKTELVKRWEGDTRPWGKESMKRCKLGGFAVTKTAVCEQWRSERQTREQP